MWLEEKVDNLKKIFPAGDFRVPFIDATKILKTIESKFIKTKNIQEDLNNIAQYCNNWPNHIKDKSESRNILLAKLPFILRSSFGSVNYWVIIVNNNVPEFKHLIYDCKPEAMIALYKAVQNSFFVVDKKYHWLLYFDIDFEKGELTLFKSGKSEIDLDNIHLDLLA